jgi:Ferredoxin
MPFDIQKKSLLDQLEMQGVYIEAHCRDGFCGTCATELKSGEVEYFKEPVAYVKNGAILPCSCRQKSAEIELII